MDRLRTNDLAATLAHAAERLRAAGVSTPKLDAELLAGLALGWSRVRVLAERRVGTIDSESRGRLATLLDRRCGREPLAYIVGEKEFWSLPLRVDARVLVPRPETETVVERALDVLRGLPAGRRRVADVGTGSGAIALAIGSEAGAADEVIAIDRSTGALAVAGENARRLASRLRLRIELVRADLLSCFQAASVDVVVANPPYLSIADLRSGDAELAFEPESALAGGDADGLAIVRRLLLEADRVLRDGGAAVIEIGAAQGEAATAAARAAGFLACDVACDLAGRDRALVARR